MNQPHPVLSYPWTPVEGKLRRHLALSLQLCGGAAGPAAGVADAVQSDAPGKCHPRGSLHCSHARAGHFSGSDINKCHLFFLPPPPPPHIHTRTMCIYLFSLSIH